MLLIVIYYMEGKANDLFCLEDLIWNINLSQYKPWIDLKT